MAKRTKKNEVASSDLSALLDRDASLDSSTIVVDEVETSVEDLPADRLISPLAGKAHFTDYQEKSKTHRHVAKVWADQCLSWDQFQDILEQSAQANKDVLVSPDQLSLGETTETLLVKDDDGNEKETERRKLTLVVDDNKVGGEYEFSVSSMAQFAGPQFCDLGSRLAGIGRDDTEIDYAFGLYRHRFERVLEQRAKKERGSDIFLRLRRDGEGVNSVRAMLSDSYAVIDHRWTAETVRGIVGDDALISHFDAERFSANGGDNVRFNVLLPDSIRKESDSDYGGMLTGNNSEVGNGRNSFLPSVFRAICMNGCIWGASKDKRFKVSRVHRGKDIDYDYLAFEIARSLNNAIPLLNDGIDMMLDAKRLKAEADIMRLTFEIAKSEFSLTKAERKALLGAIDEEPLEASAFGVTNVFTRYAQHPELSIDAQNEVEETIGRLLGRWSEKPETFALVDQNAQALDMVAEFKALGIAS